MKPLKLSLLFCCLFFIAPTLLAQDFLKAYLYSLTNNDVKKALDDKDFLEQFIKEKRLPIDSSLVKDFSKQKLANGYYVIQNVYSDRSEYLMHSVMPFEIRFLDNDTDLLILLADSSKQPITDAKLYLKGKEIPLDPTTNLHKIAKTRKEGKLEIIYQGVVFYYILDNQLPKLRYYQTGFYGLLFFKLPTKYVLRPPLWLLRGLYVLCTKGRTRVLTYPFTKVWNRIFRRDYYYYGDNDRYHKSYIATNKPQYRPQDTLFWKAIILKKNGKPYNGKIDVVIYNNYRGLATFKATPYRKGCYQGSIHLLDSLKIPKSKIVELYFENKRGKEFAQTDFLYEDYELKENYSMDLKTNKSKNIFYAKDSITFLVSAKTNNDLDVLDGKIKIVVTSIEHNNKYGIYEKKFLPNTIWKYETTLSATPPTSITLPDSLKPQLSSTLKVLVTMNSVDNTKLAKELTIDYRVHDEVVMELKGGFLNIEAQNDTLTTKTFYLKNNNTNTLQAISIPHKEPLNTNINQYTLYDAHKTYYAHFSLSDITTPIQFYQSRTVDSVFFQAANPYQIPFWYSIYKDKTEIAQGRGTELNWRKKTQDKTPYLVYVYYTWAGKLEKKFFFIQLPDEEKTEKMQLSLEYPAEVYPGEKINLDITLTDEKNKPIRDADLTAYAITNNFTENNEHIDDLEQTKKRKKQYYRRDYNTYIINDQLLQDNFFILRNNNNNSNNTIAKKDSSLQNKIYNQIITQNETIVKYTFPNFFQNTEIAFIKKIDSLKYYIPPYLLIDQKEYKRIDPFKPYVMIDSGYHNIIIPHEKGTLEMKDIYISANQRNIIVLNTNNLEKDPTITYQKKTVVNSANETQSECISSIELINTADYYFAYLKQGNQIISFGNRSEFEYEIKYWALKEDSTHFELYYFPEDSEDSIKIDFTAKKQHTTIIDLHKKDFFYKSFLDIKQFSDDDRWVYHFKNFFFNEWKGISSLPNTYFEQLKTQKLTALRNDFKRRQFNQKADKIINRNDLEGNADIQFIANDAQWNPQKVILFTLLIDKNNASNFYLFRYFPTQINRLYAGNYQMLLYTQEGKEFLAYDLGIIRPKGETFIPIQLDSTKIQSTNEQYAHLFEVYQRWQTSDTTVSTIADSLVYENITNNTEEIAQDDISGEFVSGIVYDSEGEPLPGVTVFWKGTAIGTTTDVNGRYELKRPANTENLTIQAVGYTTAELRASQNFEEIYLYEDTRKLEEVVVVGYSVDYSSSFQGRAAGINISGNPGSASNIIVRGASTLSENENALLILDGVIISQEEFLALDPNFIKNISVLKGDEAAALYGSRASNGVIVIESNSVGRVNGVKVKIDPEMQSLTGVSQQSGLRQNFSDYAFWYPTLRTNQEGKVSVPITFPDDITKWNASITAYDGKKQYQNQKITFKSFKSIMAQLALPRFLIEGDTTQFIGKSLNYTTDSLNITTSFLVDSLPKYSEKSLLEKSKIDSLLWIAPTIKGNHQKDSVKIQYQLQTDKGYIDGEIRTLAIYPKGMYTKISEWFTLPSDTIFRPNLAAFDADKPIKAHLFSSDAYLFEEIFIKPLRNYQHYCNEQLASKLIAALAEAKLQEIKGKKFQHENDIKKIIDKLLQNVNNTNLWGWWKGNNTQNWITLHILNALNEAKTRGYEVKYDFTNAKQYLYAQLRLLKLPLIDRIESYQTLLALGDTTLQYKELIQPIVDSLVPSQLSIYEQLKIIQIKQLCQMPYDLQAIWQIKQSTIWGDIFWGEGNAKMQNNILENTLLVYQILKKEGKHSAELERIEQYLLKQNNWNTYQSAIAIKTLSDKFFSQEIQPTSVKIEGSESITIDQFPYEYTIANKDELFQLSNLTKKSQPIFISFTQEQWQDEPKRREDIFEISTYFNHHKTTLKAGEEVALIAKVTVKANDSEYIAIEIPIPAGCSYSSTHQNYPNEAFREYERNKVIIYCRSLSIGTYHFEVPLLSRYQGTYTLNPASIEMMYFPSFRGNNEIMQVKIKE